jgi:hypothetical protein
MPHGENVLLINAALTILFLSDTYTGAPMISGLQMQPHTLCWQVAACSRIWASCRLRKVESASWSWKSVVCCITFECVCQYGN